MPSVFVMRRDVPDPVRTTRLAAEVLATNGPTGVRTTRVAGEVLIARASAELGYARTTRIAVQVLVTGT